MIKVNYPVDSVKKKELEHKYLELLKGQKLKFEEEKNKLSNKALNDFFKNIDYKKILVGKIEELVDMYIRYNTLHYKNKQKIKHVFEKVLSYDQSKISVFF